jgi:hypothetical protein
MLTTTVGQVTRCFSNTTLYHVMCDDSNDEQWNSALQVWPKQFCILNIPGYIKTTATDIENKDYTIKKMCQYDDNQPHDNGNRASSQNIMYITYTSHNSSQPFPIHGPVIYIDFSRTGTLSVLHSSLKISLLLTCARYTCVPYESKMMHL